MKILIYTTNLFAGGAESVLHAFVDYLVHHGNDVTVMAMPKDKNDFKTAAFAPEVRCIRARLHKKTYGNNIFLNLTNSVIRNAFRFFILLYLRLHRYDVGIAFLEGQATKDGLQIKAERRFAWVHCDLQLFHDLDWHNRYYSGISEEHRIYKSYDGVVCVSESAKEGMIASVGDTGNIYVRLNPIDWMKIRKMAEEPCDIRKDESKALIVIVGSLLKPKNQALLLEVCKLLKGKFLFDVWIIGTGEEEQNLKKYAEENKLNNVQFLGFQKNPYNLLKQADLFVSTSITESYGLAIQEAFILGVPVIAVRNPGVNEFFDERYGVLINNSVEELESAVCNFLEKPDQLQSYRKAIEETYSLDELYEGRMKDICSLWE